MPAIFKFAGMARSYRLVSLKHHQHRRANYSAAPFNKSVFCINTRNAA